MMSRFARVRGISRRRVAVAAALTGALLVALVACGQGSSGPGTQSASTPGDSAGQSGTSADGAQPGTSAVDGPGPETEATGSGDVTTVKVGVLPTTSAIAPHIGEDEGIFAKLGLKVTFQQAAGGAALIPGVLNGSLQFTFTNPVSVLVARSKGLPLKIIASAVQTGADASEDYSGLVVKKDSPITSPTDLAGKTIAVGTLHNLADFTVMEAVEPLGVDSNSLKFIEIAPPDMPAAVASGRVDAAATSEPYWTLAESEGERTILSPYSASRPNLTIAVWATTESFYNENKDLVERFAQGIAESNVFSEQHPDVVRATSEKLTGVSAEVANSMRLPHWSATLNRSDIEYLDGLCRKYGLYQDPVDIDDLIVPLGQS